MREALGRTVDATQHVLIHLSCHVPHTDTHTQFHANVLAECGYDVIVLAPGPGVATGFVPNVRVISLPRPRTFFFYNRGLRNAAVAAFERIRISVSAYKLLRDGSACSVCICTGIDAWFIAILLKRRHRWKVVGDLREVYEDRLQLLPSVIRNMATPLFRRALRSLCSNSDEVIHVSRVRQTMYSYLPKSGVIVRMMPDVADFQFHRDSRNGHRLLTIVHAGPLRSSYASNQLLTAMELLSERRIPVRLIIAGNVEGKLENHATLQRLVNSGIVELLPVVPFTTVRSLLEKSDIGVTLVLPVDTTHLFPEPRKLYEYLAAGLPVVAADAPTMRTVVEEWDCGIAVDASSPIAIADAVSLLAQDSAMRHRMSLNARRAAELAFNRAAEARALSSLVATLTNATP